MFRTSSIMLLSLVSSSITAGMHTTRSPDPGAASDTSHRMDQLILRKTPGTVHSIPLSRSYNHYVHEITLSKAPDYYLKPISFIANGAADAPREVKQR